MAPSHCQEQQVDGIPSNRPQKTRSSGRRATQVDIPLHTSTPSGAPELLGSVDRKRQADDPLRGTSPSKKLKSNTPSNFPPEFYDTLSKIWLTPRALRELDRRNQLCPQSQPIGYQPTARRIQPSRGSKALALAKFSASAGGPDLSDLRGYQAPVSSAMASLSASAASSRRKKSTKATTVTTKSKRSSAFDGNFRQHCDDNFIFHYKYDFPNGTRPPTPANLNAIRDILKAPRGSLSPSVVPKSAFKDFEKKTWTRSEGTLMRTVVPLITGNSEIPNEGNLPFNNLASITNGTTVNPVPDFFDGAHPSAVDKKVKEDLATIIIPNQGAGTPLAPNFFLEAKSSKGTFEVAEEQAILDGAHGAFIMHALQNYLAEQPVYCGEAHSFSSVLINGVLTLFAHFLVAPAQPGGRPHCYTTRLKGYILTDEDAYLEGIGAWRNLRAFAEKLRDGFVKIANARARGQATEDTDTEGDARRTMEEQLDGGSNPFDINDCRASVELEDHGQETEESQDSQVTLKAGAGLGILHQDDADEISSSFTSDFTSLDASDHQPTLRRSKRLRSPPPSSTRRLKTSRTR